MLKRASALAVLLVGLLWARVDVHAAQTAQDVTRDRAAKADRLTLDLYLDMETVAEPQLSPDGSQIVYTRGWIDKVNDKRESALWIMNTDGSRNRFLAKGSGARWSPSGDRIAYATQGEPKDTQVFVRWMDAEGATSQITRVEQAPSAVAWSPDGKQLSFSMLVEERNTWPIKMPKAPAGAKWTEAPRIVEQLTYRRDRSGFTDNGYRHVFVVPASGGTPRQITSGNFDHTGTDWTPDGRSILFSGLRSENASYQWRESEIYAVDVADGAIRQLTKRKGPDGNPTVSPDGKRVAYTGYDWTTDTWVDSKIYLMNIDGSNPRLVSGDWDRAPSELRWSADGSGLYFTAQNEGSQNLYYLPVSTPGKVTAITKGTQMLTVSDISPKGFAVGTLTTSAQPGDVVTFDLKTPASIKQLTAVNEDILAGRKLGEVKEIWYTSVDGTKIQGWYAYPSKDFDDLMAGVDALLAKGFVDPQNLFVTGCSGGGVLTAWTVGHTDRFAAASANCPVIDWLSFVGTTDGASWYYNFAKLPWEDPSEHIKRSPLTYVGNVKTPTMLMTGVNDLRTPMPQTEQFYSALKLRNVPTAMIRFNDEWHGTTSMPSNFVRTQLYLRYWFDKYKRGAERKTTTPLSDGR
jgi:dipeptidyl aminopeptidase/acylaminoacyl peptidase